MLFPLLLLPEQKCCCCCKAMAFEIKSIISFVTMLEFAKLHCDENVALLEYESVFLRQSFVYETCIYI